MTAFRVEAMASSPIYQEDEATAGGSRTKIEYLNILNTTMLDLFEENHLLWLQIAEMDTPSMLLMYAAYTPMIAEKGKVDSEADILQLWERLSVPASITLTLIEEISVTEFNRAMQRHELLCSSRRQICGVDGTDCEGQVQPGTGRNLIHRRSVPPPDCWIRWSTGSKKHSLVSVRKRKNKGMYIRFEHSVGGKP